MSTAAALTQQVLKIGITGALEHKAAAAGGGRGKRLRGGTPTVNTETLIAPYFASASANQRVSDEALDSLKTQFDTNKENIDKLLDTEECKTMFKKIFVDKNTRDEFLKTSEADGIPVELRRWIEKLDLPEKATGGGQYGGIGGVNIINIGIKTALGATSAILVGVGLATYLTQGAPPILLLNMITGGAVDQLAVAIVQKAIDVANISNRFEIMEKEANDKLEKVISENAKLIIDGGNRKSRRNKRLNPRFRTKTSRSTEYRKLKM